MKIVVSALCVMSAFAQTNRTNAPCSPIIGRNEGSVDIRCTAISDAQAKEFVELLNTILTHELKTNEILTLVYKEVKATSQRTKNIEKRFQEEDRERKLFEISDEQVRTLRQELYRVPGRVMIRFVVIGTKTAATKQLETALPPNWWIVERPFGEVRVSGVPKPYCEVVVPKEPAPSASAFLAALLKAKIPLPKLVYPDAYVGMTGVNEPVPPITVVMSEQCTQAEMERRSAAQRQ